MYVVRANGSPRACSVYEAAQPHPLSYLQRTPTGAQAVNLFQTIHLSYCFSYLMNHFFTKQRAINKCRVSIGK